MVGKLRTRVAGRSPGLAPTENKVVAKLAWSRCQLGALLSRKENATGIRVELQRLLVIKSAAGPSNAYPEFFQPRQLFFAAHFAL
jgi:hypothetical protein